jgi:hypothetical protein
VFVELAIATNNLAALEDLSFGDECCLSILIGLALIHGLSIVLYMVLCRCYCTGVKAIINHNM